MERKKKQKYIDVLRSCIPAGYLIERSFMYPILFFLNLFRSNYIDNQLQF